MFAENGAVAGVGRGQWQRCDIEAPAAECRTPHPFTPAWTNAIECLLDAVFSAAPRRLSHLTALEAAGVPLVARPQLSFPRESARTAMPLGIAVFSEPRDRLCLFAARLTERTWISSPERAAIETAQHDIAARRWNERIAWVLAEGGGSIFDADEAVEASDALQMRAGLRRLSFIAHALRQLAASDALGRVPDEWADIVRARRGDRWIRLRRSGPTGRTGWRGQSAQQRAGAVNARRPRRPQPTCGQREGRCVLKSSSKCSLAVVMTMPPAQAGAARAGLRIALLPGCYRSRSR
ncbi:hypothetical protein [Candidatus Poriferisodalis sp.]|uniref:hypothetical protein n=1 Tax=Candidatus Poriferisodalis sp. TaxID=3101277 RepID=UPI003B019A71